MNKSDLVKVMVEAGPIGSKAAAERALNAALESIKKTLKNGERVTISGFGTFSVRASKARQGINPQTGQTIYIPAKTVPKFTPGKELKEAVK